MNKIARLFLAVLLFATLTWGGLCLADLAYIGGYDGFAPEQLAREFWYGSYSHWTGVVEVAAMAAMVIGLAGTVVSMFMILFLTVKAITKRFTSAA